jgi:hypothetical protein
MISNLKPDQPSRAPLSERYITTLNAAISNNRPDIAKSLLENRANVNEQNAVGNTPLHLAITNNSPDMVKILLENGANVNERNLSGATPLHLANNKNPKISKLLLEKGADTSATNSVGRTPLDINPVLVELNKQLQNFKVRKPLLQLTQGLRSDKVSGSDYNKLRYLNEMNAKEIAGYLSGDTKGGKHKRKTRKTRKSRKTRKTRKSRKYRRH